MADEKQDPSQRNTPFDASRATDNDSAASTPRDDRNVVVSRAETPASAPVSTTRASGAHDTRFPPASDFAPRRSAARWLPLLLIPVVGLGVYAWSKRGQKTTEAASTQNGAGAAGKRDELPAVAAVPVVAGVPLMSPVAVLRESPAGRPSAANPVGDLVAVI